MLLLLFQKFLGKNPSYHSTQVQAVQLEQEVRKIQQGDLRLRNQLITDYQPYVAKVTSQFCKRYIDPARDDEFSIALSAFNEAINQYCPDSGRSFLSFAQLVIQRRLIDYVRAQQKYTEQTPFSSFDIEDEDQNIVNPIVRQQSIEQYEKEQQIAERQAEIRELHEQLLEYGISFNDLVNSSPKHVDSRWMLIEIGHILAGNQDLMGLLLQKKTLPIKQLMEFTHVSRKTLERNRKYLIAIALIIHGKYPYLRDYVQTAMNVKERSGDND